MTFIVRTTSGGGRYLSAFFFYRANPFIFQQATVAPKGWPFFLALRLIWFMMNQITCIIKHDQGAHMAELNYTTDQIQELLQRVDALRRYL